MVRIYVWRVLCTFMPVTGALFASGSSSEDTASSFHPSDLSPDDTDSEPEAQIGDELAQLSSETRLWGLNPRQRAHVLELRRERNDISRNRSRGSSGRGGAKGSRSGSTGGRGPEHMARWFSVTCSVLNTDFHEVDFNKFATFFTDYCPWGAVAYEKGTRVRHWHAQGVCKLETTSARMAKNDCLRFLEWYPYRSPYGGGLHLVFKELKHRDLHTPEGMLGYCFKDMDEYEGWCSVVSDSVTDGQIERGMELYGMYGAPEKATVVTLTRLNLMDRVTAFYKVNKRRGMFHIQPTPLEEVILAMLSGGNFRPSAEWIIPRFGQGASYTRMADLFRLYRAPETATLDDVAQIFFTEQVGTQILHYMPAHSETLLSKFTRSGLGVEQQHRRVPHEPASSSTSNHQNPCQQYFPANHHPGLRSNSDVGQEPDTDGPIWSPPRDEPQSPVHQALQPQSVSPAQNIDEADGNDDRAHQFNMQRVMSRAQYVEMFNSAMPSSPGSSFQDAEQTHRCQLLQSLLSINEPESI